MTRSTPVLVHAVQLDIELTFLGIPVNAVEPDARKNAIAYVEDARLRNSTLIIYVGSSHRVCQHQKAADGSIDYLKVVVENCGLQFGF